MGKKENMIEDHVSLVSKIDSLLENRYKSNNEVDIKDEFSKLIPSEESSTVMLNDASNQNHLNISKLLTPSEDKTNKLSNKSLKKKDSNLKTGITEINLNEINQEKTTNRIKKAYDRRGFGYKGLGSRKIYYNKEIDEHVYEIIEPDLSDSEKELLEKIVYLFGVSVDVDVEGLREVEKNHILEDNLEKIIIDNHIEISGDTKDRIFYHIFQDFIGYGKIDILMHDNGIEDISCDGIDSPVFIYHKDLESIRTNIVFNHSEELDNFVVKLAQICDKQISVYSPIVDGKLEDGSRLHVTLSKTVTRDSNFTIRRFHEEPLTPIDLIDNNTFSLDMAAYFWLAIEHNSNILFCGGTASGKTTSLNALALFIPYSHKIVSIEDTREVNLPHENWIAGTTRTGFSQVEKNKSDKDIDMFDLTRAALRQRPKVIVVGEVRGREAYTLFQAMTTGHVSYSTVHAGDIRTLIQRLESPPINLPRSLLTAVDVVVFMNSISIDQKPVRRFTSVMEIIKLDSGSNRLITFTPFSWLSESDKFEMEEGSRNLQRIKSENSWSDKELEKEIDMRKRILSWMLKKDIRSYKDVSKIISQYYKNPSSVLKMVEEDGL